MIDQILDYNKDFVARKGYEKYLTDKYPDKKLAVLSCMDTRLTELLPAALGLKNGDAKIIKNAGGLVISAFDSAMRSLIVAIYELGVREIMVVAHSHCGACHMSFDHFHHEMIARGTRHSTPSASAASTCITGWRDSRTRPSPSARPFRPLRPIRSSPRTSWFVGSSLIQRQEPWRRYRETYNPFSLIGIMDAMLMRRQCLKEQDNRRNGLRGSKQLLPSRV